MGAILDFIRGKNESEKLRRNFDSFGDLDLDDDLDLSDDIDLSDSPRQRRSSYERPSRPQKEEKPARYFATCKYCGVLYGAWTTPLLKMRYTDGADSPAEAIQHLQRYNYKCGENGHEPIITEVHE